MSYLRVLVIAALVLGTASLASASVGPYVQVDEWGHAVGDVSFVGYMPDPTYGYLYGPVLIYGLPFPVVPGDLRITEPPTSMLSDVIRFTDNGLMIFYSDGTEGLDEPADISWPLEQINPYIGLIAYREEIGPEGYNYVLYTPLPVEPGYLLGAQVQYKFISDLPEPATLSLLALGGLGALLRRRPVRAGVLARRR